MRCAPESARPTKCRHRSVIAQGLIVLGSIDVKVDITSNKQVHPAIIVVVGEGCARVPGVAALNAGHPSNLGECAVPSVAEEFIRTKVRDEQIGEPIIVKVSGSASLPPSPAC